MMRQLRFFFTMAMKKYRSRVELLADLPDKLAYEF